MNSRTWGIIIGIIVAVIFFGVLIYINMHVSSTLLAEDDFTPIPESLEEGRDFTQVLQGLETHGDIPVDVQSNEIGRENPFSE